MRVDGERVGSRDAVLKAGSTYLLQAGKRAFARVTLTRSPESFREPLTPAKGRLYCAPPSSGGPEKDGPGGFVSHVIVLYGAPWTRA